MSQQLSITDPAAFLNEIFAINQLAAVHIADAWGGRLPTDPTYNPAQYQAAWQISDRQTILPHCEWCKWTIVDPQAHTSCDEKLSHRAAEIDEALAYDAETDYPDDEEVPTTNEVFHRALAHTGNAEMASEAAHMYPGDYI